MPEVNKALSTIMAMKQKIGQLPTEQDLRNTQRNFMELADPIAKLIDDCQKTDATHISKESVVTYCCKALQILGHVVATKDEMRCQAIPKIDKQAAAAGLRGSGECEIRPRAFRWQSSGKGKRNCRHVNHPESGSRG